jgi:hypothetical protein
MEIISLREYPKMYSIPPSVHRKPDYDMDRNKMLQIYASMYKPVDTSRFDCFIQDSHYQYGLKNNSDRLTLNSNAEKVVQAAREAIESASETPLSAADLMALVEPNLIEVETESYHASGDTPLTEAELIDLAMALGSTEDSDSEDDEDAEPPDSEDG